MGLPFGQTVRLWRLTRRLTQAQLASAAGVPRPNLSAIERGKREVSLTTLRALAVALEVTPGALADGMAPEAPQGSLRLSREALERIADAIVPGRRILRDPVERDLAALLGRLSLTRIRAASRHGRRAHAGVRADEAAWLRAHACYPPELIRTLLERVDDRLRAHGPLPN